MRLAKLLSSLVLVAVSLSAGNASPARAQGVYSEVEFGRAAFAYWEDFANQRYAYVLAGQGVLYNSDLGEPLVGEIGCAAVVNATRAAFGCGPLSSFAISDDLGSASGKGTFDALVYDQRSGAMTRNGKISFDATWKATGDVVPRAQGGYFVFGGGLVEAYVATAPVGRDAHGGINGGVTSSPAGRSPRGSPTGGAILAGSDITIAIH